MTTSRRRTTWTYLPVWIAFWCSLILLDVLNDVLQAWFYATPRREFTWMVQEWTAFWGLWIVVSLAVPPLVRRVNPDLLGWWRTVLVHAVASVVFTGVQLALAAVAFQLMDRDNRSYWERLSGYFSSLSIRSVLIYWVLLAALLAWNYWRRSAQRELDVARFEASTARLELAVTEAKLETLRRDLNPHFLFNALNGLSGLVRAGESGTAVEMISRLGRLLRVGMDRNVADLIPLRDEVDNARQYLEIEKLRVGSRLVVKWEVESGDLGVPVPCFILQPLAENAVRHAVGRSTKPVVVTLRATRADDRLTLEVEDSGPGLQSGRGEPGIGLANTGARLDLMYGDGGSLEVVDAPSGGALARVVVPIIPPMEISA